MHMAVSNNTMLASSAMRCYADDVLAVLLYYRML